MGPVVKQKADEEQEKESVDLVSAPQMTENKGVVENKDLVTRSNSSSSSVGSKGRGSLSKESFTQRSPALAPHRGGGGVAPGYQVLVLNHAFVLCHLRRRNQVHALLFLLFIRFLLHNRPHRLLDHLQGNSKDLWLGWLLLCNSTTT